MIDDGNVAPGTPAHPEEMTARLRFRIGSTIAQQATVRATPAGVGTELHPVSLDTHLSEESPER